MARSVHEMASPSPPPTTDRRAQADSIVNRLRSGALNVPRPYDSPASASTSPAVPELTLTQATPSPHPSTSHVSASPEASPSSSPTPSSRRVLSPSARVPAPRFDPTSSPRSPLSSPPVNADSEALGLQMALGPAPLGRNRQLGRGGGGGPAPADRSRTPSPTTDPVLSSASSSNSSWGTMGVLPGPSSGPVFPHAAQFNQPIPPITPDRSDKDLADVPVHPRPPIGIPASHLPISPPATSPSATSSSSAAAGPSTATRDPPPPWTLTSRSQPTTAPAPPSPAPPGSRVPIDLEVLLRSLQGDQARSASGSSQRSSQGQSLPVVAGAYGDLHALSPVRSSKSLTTHSEHTELSTAFSPSPRVLSEPASPTLDVRSSGPLANAAGFEQRILGRSPGSSVIRSPPPTSDGAPVRSRPTSTHSRAGSDIAARIRQFEQRAAEQQAQPPLPSRPSSPVRPSRPIVRSAPDGGTDDATTVVVRSTSRQRMRSNETVTSGDSQVTVVPIPPAARPAVVAIRPAEPTGPTRPGQTPIKRAEDMFYSPSDPRESSTWLPCTVELYEDALVVVYVPIFGPNARRRQTLSISLAGRPRVESMRPPSGFVGDTAARAMVKIEWPDGRGEMVACKTAVERVDWTFDIRTCAAKLAAEGQTASLPNEVEIARAVPLPASPPRPTSRLLTAEPSTPFQHLSLDSNNAPISADTFGRRASSSTVRESQSTFERRQEDIDRGYAALVALPESPPSSAGPDPAQLTARLVAHSQQPSRDRSARSSRSPSAARTPHLSPTTSRIQLRDDGPVRRGAWSDVDRHSIQSSASGYVPGRAIRRDMQRLLVSLHRRDSRSLSRDSQLGAYLGSVEAQLTSIAERLRSGHDDAADQVQGGEPTVVDKIDYMLSLCRIMLETQNKVSSAVEHGFRQHGIVSPPPLPSQDPDMVKAEAFQRMTDQLATLISKLDASPTDSPIRRFERSSQSPGRTFGSTPDPAVPTADPRWSAHSDRELPAVPRETDPATEAQRILHNRAEAQRLLEQGADPVLRTVEEPSRFSPHTSPTDPANDPTLPSRSASRSPVTPTAGNFGEARLGGDITPRATIAPDLVEGLLKSNVEHSEMLHFIARELQGLARKTTLEQPGQPDQVASYLQRLDRFMRDDAERRTNDWQQLAGSVTSLQAQLAALSVAGLSHSSPVMAPPVTLERRPTNSDGPAPPLPPSAPEPVEPAAPTVGRSTSLLRRLKGSAPPPTTTDDAAASPPGKLRKRSLSMPRVAGPRLPVRLWGGPRPAQEAERLQRWGGGSQSGRSHTTEDVLKDAATFRYEPPMDAMAKLGLALDDAKSTKSERGPPSVAPAAAAMPYTASAPDLRMRAQQPMSDDGHGGYEGLPPSQSSYNVVAQDTMIQESLREVLAHLRARAMRDHEREAREADEAQRRANRLGTDEDGQGHAELDESSKRQNALEKKAEAFDMRAREQRIDEALRHLTTQASTADSNIKRMLELHQTKMAEEAAGVGRGPGPEDGARFLEELRDRATHELKVFRQALAVETRTALDEVGQLRDQKRTLQQELSELFAWKVKHTQGAPDLPLPARSPVKGGGAGAFPVAGKTFSPATNSDGRQTFAAHYPKVAAVFGPRSPAKA